MTDATAKLLFLVNPFKGTMGSVEVAAACEAAADAEGVAADVVPGSDGGDGLLDACLAAGVVRRLSYHDVSGPLLAPVRARIAWLATHTAVIESSEAIGLRLVAGPARDPLKADTRGVGELIAVALEQGATAIQVGLGGSATMDGGLGMARLWGWRPFDRRGRPLAPGGGELARLARLELGWRPACRLTGLVDVVNPLLGAEGARVYAQQKGAREGGEDRLVRGLENLVAVTASLGGVELSERPGAGAAGGLGYGVLMFGGGSLRSGSDWLMHAFGLDQRLRRARAVVTAEGAFDATSWSGKLTGRVISASRDAGVPVGLLAPRVAAPLDSVVVETGGGTWDREELVRRARNLIRRLVRLPRS